MKTALLQCNPVTGDIAGNVEKIAAAVRRAGDVDLCVTPELALSGLNPGDYLSMNDFVEGCRRGLDILAETFKDGPDLLVGAPVISVYDPKLLPTPRCTSTAAPGKLSRARSVILPARIPRPASLTAASPAAS